MEKPIIVSFPTVPANNATIVLFATHDRLAGGSGALYKGMSGLSGASDRGGARPVQFQHISSIEIVWLQHNKASAALGVRLYAKDNGGAWREADLTDDTGAATLPVQVPAKAAGAEYRLMLDISRYALGWAVEYTAGADNPENWSGVISLWTNILAQQK